MYIWDWRLAEKLRLRGKSALWGSRAKLGESKGYQDQPPAVHGVAWNAGAASPEFVTYGNAHVKRHWWLDGAWTCKVRAAPRDSPLPELGWSTGGSLLTDDGLPPIGLPRPTSKFLSCGSLLDDCLPD